MSPPGPRFGQDPAVASWLGPRLTGTWGHVTSVVPEGYEAYARVLHPVQDQHGRLVPWSSVAEDAGTRVHALAQWRRLARPRPDGSGWWTEVEPPEEGSLPAETVRRLIDVLGRHTGTVEDCWFGLWSGFGWVQGGHAVQRLRPGQPAVETREPSAFSADELAEDRLVRLPGREYLLGHGPLEAATGLGWQAGVAWFLPQSPNLCWPGDRAWCLATEIDFDSTLVGGSAALVAELVGHPGLEAWRVRPGDSLQHDADRLN